MVMLTHRQRQVVASGTRLPASARPTLSILPSTHPTASPGTRVAMEVGRVHRLHPPLSQQEDDRGGMASNDLTFDQPTHPAVICPLLSHFQNMSCALMYSQSWWGAVLGDLVVTWTHPWRWVRPHLFLIFLSLSPAAPHSHTSGGHRPVRCRCLLFQHPPTCSHIS